MDLEAVYDTYVDTVYKFFYIKCLNRHIAEDLTADTFTAYIRQAQGTQIQDQKKYLYGIMRIVWTTFLRDKYQEKVSKIENIEDFATYAHETIEEFEQTEEPVTRLMPYVQNLPERQRTVVMLRVFQNMSVKDTAYALGKDANYVKTTYARALRRLRSILDNPITERKETI